MTSLIVANFLGAALYSVLTAAGLQFLGLGDPNSISWGTMLYWAQSQEALQTGMPLWSIAPGVCVALLGVSFALLNYAFDEISNPALRPVQEATCQVALSARRSSEVRDLHASSTPTGRGAGRRRRRRRPRRARGRVRRRRRRVRLRQVDAAVRDRPAAQPAGRDHRRQRHLPGPEPGHDDRQAAARAALAGLLGRHAERDERAQPGHDDRRAVQGRARRRTPGCPAADPAALGRGAATGRHRPDPPEELSAPALAAGCGSGR